MGASFLVLGVMQEYRHLSGGKPVAVSSYRDAKDQLDPVFANGRLGLPFEGACCSAINRPSGTWCRVSTT